MINYKIRSNGETIGFLELRKGETLSVDQLQKWVALWRKKQGHVRYFPATFELIISDRRILRYNEPPTTFKHFIKIKATGSISVKLFLPEKDCYQALAIIRKMHEGLKHNCDALHVTMNRVSIDSERYTRCKHALKRVIEYNQMKVDHLKLQAVA